MLSQSMRKLFFFLTNVVDKTAGVEKQLSTAFAATSVDDNVFHILI
jgi:hypothetical protein